jgi:hypothetical protein
MKPSTKLTLDILMGAVIPILILNFLTAPLGAPMAYVLAALVPVGWVLADLLFITRQFNVITSAVGATAVANGALAFWFVDGVLFALKDTAGLLMFSAALVASVLAARPLMRYVFGQSVGADTPAKRTALDGLLREPPVAHSMRDATLVIAFQQAVVSGVNFLLNLNVVTAPFGTEAFNQQVAQVNAMTRVGFPLASIAAFVVAFWIVQRGLRTCLPVAEGETGWGDDFWRAMDRREARPAEHE